MCDGHTLESIWLFVSLGSVTAEHTASSFAAGRSELPVLFNDISIHRANRDFVQYYTKWLQAQFPQIAIRLDIRKPAMNFRRVIEKYGYPVISKEVSQHVKDARSCPNGKVAARFHGAGSTSMIGWAKYEYLLDAPFKIDHRCCDVMKKRPAHAYEKETGLHPLIATMASESLLRKRHWKATGCNAFEGERPVSRPISFWNEQDVLRYLSDHKIPDFRVFQTGIYEAQYKRHFTPFVLRKSLCDKVGQQCAVLTARKRNVALPLPRQIPLRDFLVCSEVFFFQRHRLQLSGRIRRDWLVVVQNRI